MPVVHAAAPYEDEVRAALLAHKERGALALAAPLGTALAGAVRAALGHGWSTGPGVRPTRLDGRLRPVNGHHGPEGGGTTTDGAVLLVPVPSSRRAVRARGHDPARRIALAAAGELRRTGTPARVIGALRQRRAVADQSGLDSWQRLGNLAGALEVAVGAARMLADSGRVVVVDDLMTTGASLTEAARAVRVAMTDAWDAATREAAGVRMPEATAGARMAGRNRTQAVRGMPGLTAAGDLICAAVVAAPPDSFEMNRN